MRRSRHQGTETALANFALTFAKALLVFCVVLFMMISPDAKKNDGVKPKAELLITVEWEGKLHYDVDTWLQLPDANIVHFRAKESGIVFLERDDRGTSCDEPNDLAGTTPSSDGMTCQEIVTVRGLTPGEYVLNLHLYSVGGEWRGPAKVRVKVIRMNPSVVTLMQKEVVLDQLYQEKHVTRFTITDSGYVGQFDSNRPTNLTTRN